MENFIYILSISFQVAGALLLMFFSISTKRESILNDFFGKGLSTREDNSDEVKYNHKVFIDYYIRAYLSKFSFLYIAIGYALGVFGSITNMKKIFIVFSIFVCTAILMWFAYFLARKIVLKSKTATQTVTYTELEKLGLNVDTEIISTETIESLFNCKDETSEENA